MTVDERPSRIDAELAYRYIALAEQRGGPHVLERTALRTRSRQARDLFAYAASAGRWSADELISYVRAPRERADVPTTLDPEWLLALARVIGMQNLDQHDLGDAVSLLEELRRREGPSAFRRADHRGIIDRLWQAGATDLLRSWLPELKRLKPEAHRYLQADLVNPFRANEVEDRSVGDARRWQRLVDQMFAEHGIEPITVAPGAVTPFDGLTCRVDDAVTDGPLISVIVSVFKPGPGLLTSVRSICGQTWRNLEILLMDDGSPDEYSALLEQCVEMDPRVRLHRMTQNGGTYLARNAALDLAKGKFVTCQDADDWAHPRRLELQARALLADPDTPATRSYCLRVQEDLHFQRPGYETRQENAVSLMFRREQALKTVGYFDRSRKAADTEYRRRLELATGRTVTDLHAPLSMYRMGSGSLSRADFTPGWHHPARVVYRNAYDRWHKWSAPRGDYFLGRFPEERPFAIPQPFQIDQKSIEERPPHYDVVLLADWRKIGVDDRASLAEVETLNSAGYRVGIAHRESFSQMTQRRWPLRPEILDLINAGAVDFVALDQAATASLLVVRSPEVLQFAPAVPATIDVAEVVIVADQPPCESGGGDPPYNPGICDANVRYIFAVEPQWTSESPTVRSLLSDAVPARRVTSTRWALVEGVDSLQAPRARLRGGRPILGRHAEDGPLAWPASRDDLLAVYPDHESNDVRVIGSTQQAAAILGSLPSTWTTYRVGEIDIQDFIDQIDIYVYFPHPTRAAAFEPNVARAMARGCVAILPPRFEPIFGDGALYVEPGDVPELVQSLQADLTAYQAQSERGLTVIQNLYGRDAYLATVADHVGRASSDTSRRTIEEPRGIVVGESHPALHVPDVAPAKREQGRGLRVVLTVSTILAPHLNTTLQRIWDDERLIGVPLTVIYGPESQAYVDAAAIVHPNVEFVRGEDESQDALATAAFDALTRSDQMFVSVGNLPRARNVRSWARALCREYRRMQPIQFDSPMPVLLWTRQCSRQAVTMYLAYASGVARGRIFADYLGRLALLSASPRVEAIDPRDGSLDVFVWLSGKFSPDMGQPVWRYKIGLARRGVVTAYSAPVPLLRRVDNRGNRVWENIKGTMSLSGVRNGDYVCTIELDTEVEALRTRRRLRPAKGVLLDARTVHMLAGDGSKKHVRYLVHTLGAGNIAYLTVQSGKGARAKFRWAATMIRKDVASAVRRRGSVRLLLLRLVRLLTRPFFAGRQVWLIGERTDTAQDNGLHLFRHLRRTEPTRQVYYVIDPKSPQRERVAGLGNVIAHSSLRHQLLMLHAEVLANAYSIRYLTPLPWGHANYVRHLAWRVGALRIYLKHGVHLNPNPFKRGLSGYDMVLTVMSRESEALRAVSGYDHQIREIGMPRYDGLTPAPASRTVLFMPTWRQYLVPRLNGKPNPGQIPFEGSTYEKFIVGVLQSPRLHEILEKYNYQLTFLPHYNVASHFDDTIAGTDRISLADTNATSFQDLLRSCDAFITDYSSVHFDVAYLETPVIYARFDEAEYEAGHASRSWFDYERDGYGPVVRTVQETLDALEQILERGCMMEDVYAERVVDSFTYRDRDNSARVAAAIDELAASRRREIELS